MPRDRTTVPLVQRNIFPTGVIGCLRYIFTWTWRPEHNKPYSIGPFGIAVEVWAAWNIAFRELRRHIRLSDQHVSLLLNHGNSLTYLLTKRVHTTWTIYRPTYIYTVPLQYLGSNLPVFKLEGERPAPGSRNRFIEYLDFLRAQRTARAVPVDLGRTITNERVINEGDKPAFLGLLDLLTHQRKMPQKFQIAMTLFEKHWITASC